MTIALLLMFAFFLTVLGIVIFKKIASSIDRLRDIPNERSSHSTPVIRGAGIVIVTVTLIVYVASLGSAANLAFVVTAASVALIGFADDLYSLPSLPRLVVHASAAAILVLSGHRLAPVSFVMPGVEIDLGLVWQALAILFIVWMTNAFNFMDGIDGIAGSQGVAAGLGWVILGLATDNHPITVFGSLIVGTCAGFLLFNWEPASVFMGDAGSTFLGFTLASASILTGSQASISDSYAILATVAFLWMFLFDTIFTRIKMLISGKAFWNPHREHLYQKLVISGISHRTVTMFYFLCGVLIAATAMFRAEIRSFLLPLTMVTCPTLLLLWARKKEIDVT
ncbi:MAG TPA: glycosyltransferase family 4 protein [Pyrinomonadaceae bacterium]